MSSTKNKLPSFRQAANHPDKIYRASFRSASAGENGIGDAIPPTPNNTDITADGLDSNGSAAYRIPWTASEEAELEAGGAFVFEVDAAFNKDGYTPSSVNYFMGFGTLWIEHKTNRNLRLQFGSGSSPNDIPTSQYGKVGTYPISLVWTNFDDIQLRVDHLPIVTHTNLASWGTTFTNNSSFGSLTSLISDYEGNRIKDLYVLDKPPIETPTESILFLGDSYTTQGGIPDWIYSPSAGNSAPLWITSNGLTSGNGFASDGITDAGDSVYGDASLVPTVFRELYKSGIYTENNKNYAQSGGTAAQAITKHTEAIAGGYVPTVVNIILGANTIATSRTIATEESDLQTLIQNIYDNGTPKVLIGTPISIEADTQYQTSAKRAKTTDYNNMISDIKQWTIDQGFGDDFLTVVDLFNTFGGLNVDPSDFQKEGVCSSAEVTAGGSGYTVADELTIVGGAGSGAIAYVVSVDGGGAITEVNFNSGGATGGSGYASGESFSATVTGGTGVGATFTVHTGNLHPSEKGQYKMGARVAASMISTIEPSLSVSDGSIMTPII